MIAQWTILCKGSSWGYWNELFTYFITAPF